MLLAVGCLATPGSLAAQASNPAEEFQRMAAQLAERRLAGAEEDEAAQTRALAWLDRTVLDALNDAPPATAETINRRLAELVAPGSRLGEGYQLLALGPDAFLLSANFGFAGPSAVRVYGRSPEAGRGYELVARIDRFTQQEYFDEYLEVALLSAEEGVFVTVTGRTDELKTGGFMAWRFASRRLVRFWATDLLERSSYEVTASEFRLSFCAETEEDDPLRCARMVRERYTWRGGWRRVE
jgi:hypothetical protein